MSVVPLILSLGGVTWSHTETSLAKHDVRLMVSLGNQQSSITDHSLSLQHHLLMSPHLGRTGEASHEGGSVISE